MQHHDWLPWRAEEMMGISNLILNLYMSVKKYLSITFSFSSTFNFTIFEIIFYLIHQSIATFKVQRIQALPVLVLTTQPINQYGGK